MFEFDIHQPSTFKILLNNQEISLPLINNRQCSSEDNVKWFNFDSVIEDSQC